MGRREPDYQTTICCVVSLSQLLKEASIAVNTLSLSHSNKEVSHPQAEAKKKKSPGRHYATCHRRASQEQQSHSAPWDPLTWQ